MHLIFVQCSIQLAAGTAGQLTFLPAPGEVWALHQLDVTFDAAITADNTDYITARPYKDHGTGAPLAAARTTQVASGGFAAGDNLLYGPSGSNPTPGITWTTPLGSGMELTRDAPLTYQITHSGSGKAVKITGCAVFQRIRSAA